MHDRKMFSDLHFDSKMGGSSTNCLFEDRLVPAMSLEARCHGSTTYPDRSSRGIVLEARVRD